MSLGTYYHQAYWQSNDVGVRMAYVFPAEAGIHSATVFMATVPSVG